MQMKNVTRNLLATLLATAALSLVAGCAAEVGDAGDDITFEGYPIDHAWEGDMRVLNCPANGPGGIPIPGGVDYELYFHAAAYRKVVNGVQTNDWFTHTQDNAAIAMMPNQCDPNGGPLMDEFHETHPKNYLNA